MEIPFVNPSDRDVIERLAELRKILNRSQDEVARQLGVAQPSVSVLEKQGRSLTMSTLNSYAAALGLTVSVTLSGPYPSYAVVSSPAQIDANEAKRIMALEEARFADLYSQNPESVPPSETPTTFIRDFLWQPHHSLYDLSMAASLCGSETLMRLAVTAVTRHARAIGKPMSVTVVDMGPCPQLSDLSAVEREGLMTRLRAARSQGQVYAVIAQPDVCTELAQTSLITYVK